MMGAPSEPPWVKTIWASRPGGYSWGKQTSLSGPRRARQSCDRRRRVRKCEALSRPERHPCLSIIVAALGLRTGPLRINGTTSSSHTPSRDREGGPAASVLFPMATVPSAAWGLRILQLTLFSPGPHKASPVDGPPAGIIPCPRECRSRLRLPTGRLRLPSNSASTAGDALCRRQAAGPRPSNQTGEQTIPSDQHSRMAPTHQPSASGSPSSLAIL